MVMVVRHVQRGAAFTSASECPVAGSTTSKPACASSTTTTLRTTAYENLRQLKSASHKQTPHHDSRKHNVKDQGSHNIGAREGRSANTQTSRGAATHHLFLRDRSRAMACPEPQRSTMLPPRNSCATTKSIPHDRQKGSGRAPSHLRPPAFSSQQRRPRGFLQLAPNCFDDVCRDKSHRS